MTCNSFQLPAKYHINTQIQKFLITRESIFYFIFDLKILRVALFFLPFHFNLVYNQEISVNDILSSHF